MPKWHQELASGFRMPSDITKTLPDLENIYQKRFQNFKLFAIFYVICINLRIGGK